MVPGESVELQAKRKGADDGYVVGGKGMIYLLIYINLPYWTAYIIVNI